MEENILIKSRVSRSVKAVFIWIITICAILSVCFLLGGISASASGKSEWRDRVAEWKKEIVEDAYVNYGEHTGEYCCNYAYSYRFDIYCDSYFDTADEYLEHLEDCGHYNYDEHPPEYDSFYHAQVWYILHWSFAGLAWIFYLSWFLLSRCSITVADKNVYGKTSFGKKVTLPLYMISAYATTRFLSRIAITTTSGTIKFSCIENKDEIGAILQQLINERQEKTTAQESVIVQNQAGNNLDNLTKLKTLLDSGIITQEEFDKKKKEILGI